MKTIVALIALFALVSIRSYSQDVIHFRSGKKEQVKVSEITERTVRYRMYDNPTGPEYVADKSKIEKIVYENGTEELFAAPASAERKPRPEKAPRQSIDYGRHFIGANLADLFRTDVCLHYEFLFPGDELALRVPLLIGFNNDYFNVKSRFQNPYVFRRNRVFETGLDLRWYPGGQGKVRYVMGPALHYILNNKRGPLSPYSGQPVGNHHVNTIRYMLYNGIVFSPVPHFQFGFDVGLGSQYDLSDTQYTDGRVFGDPKIQFNFYMGGKF